MNDTAVTGGTEEDRMDELIDLGRQLWNHPEPGFFEERTHSILKTAFENEGFQVSNFSGMPGFSAVYGGGDLKGRYAVIADMDALPNPGTGGYIHSCGHHMQGTALFGAARILAERHPEVLQHLVFVAVPAEEYIDLDRRKTYADKNGLSALSGKQELLARGFFQPLEGVIATHAAGGKGRFINSVRFMNGFVVRRFVFHGLSAHAGAQPHRGKNAQNAAVLFLQACAFLRESFYEEDHVRIHPVLFPAEGQSVNLIPDYARVETYVRAVTPQAVRQTALKLEDAAQGCASALGIQCSCDRIEGYQPFVVDQDLHDLASLQAEDLGVPFVDEAFSAASSDMGDLSQVKPAIILGLPGSNGLFHNPDFSVTDEETAYVFSSEVLAEYLAALVRKNVT